MIPRPFTCCSAILAIASGFFLYTKKHQTTLLDQQISRIVSETQHVRAQTAMLRTEWALENQPERLTHLAEHHLPDLHPMEPVQFVRMADLGKNLPPLSGPVMAQAAAPSTVAAVAVKPPVTAVVAVAKPVSHLPQDAHVHTTAVSYTSAEPAIRPVQTTLTVQSPAPAAVHHTLTITGAAAHDSKPQPVKVLTAQLPASHEVRLPAPKIMAAQVIPSALPVAVHTRQAEVRHPLPLTVASWHAPRTRQAAPSSESGYVEARAGSSYDSGSLLSRSGTEMAPPVPVSN